jgi:hypothetical protein
VFAPLFGPACLPESSLADRAIVGIAARRCKGEGLWRQALAAALAVKVEFALSPRRGFARMGRLFVGFDAAGAGNPQSPELS